MATRRDARIAGQVVRYMELAIGLSPQALVTIIKSSAVGPFVLRLASTDPDLMYVHLKNAEKERAASEKRLAQAERAKQRQRESNEDTRQSKKVKHNPAPKASSIGSADGQVANVKVKSYLARQKPALGSRRGRSTTPETHSTASDQSYMDSLNSTVRRSPDSRQSSIFVPDGVTTQEKQKHAAMDALSDSAPQPGIVCAGDTVHSSNDDRSEDDSDNDHLTARGETPDSESGSRYEKEVGITFGTPAIVEPLMAYCIEEFEHVGMSRQADRKCHAQEVFEACQYLDFETARISLWRFLDDRSKVPGRSVEMPSTWNVANAAEALDALQTIANSSADLKIHHAFAQMRLYSLVQEKSELTGSSSLYILRELAGKKAGDVSDFERRQLTSKYRAEYLSGEKWQAMGSWFGGDAIVIVFVTADIAPSDVGQRWNVFQRQCMAFLSEHLYSTQRLVETLGEGALEYYCRHGRLTDEVKEAIQDLDGYE